MAQAATLGGVVRPIMKAEVAKIPVGQAIIFTASMGIGDVIKALVHQFSQGRIPQWAAGFVAAWVLANTKMVRSLVTNEVADLAALALVADAVNDQFALTQRTSDFVGGLVGQRIVSNSPPIALSRNARVTAPSAGGGRTDLYAGIFT